MGRNTIKYIKLQVDKWRIHSSMQHERLRKSDNSAKNLVQKQKEQRQTIKEKKNEKPSSASAQETTQKRQKSHLFMNSSSHNDSEALRLHRARYFPTFQTGYHAFDYLADNSSFSVSHADDEFQHEVEGDVYPEHDYEQEQDEEQSFAHEVEYDDDEHKCVDFAAALYKEEDEQDDGEKQAELHTETEQRGPGPYWSVIDEVEYEVHEETRRSKNNCVYEPYFKLSPEVVYDGQAEEKEAEEPEPQKHIHEDMEGENDWSPLFDSDYLNKYREDVKAMVGEIAASQANHVILEAKRGFDMLLPFVDMLQAKVKATHKKLQSQNIRDEEYAYLATSPSGVFEYAMWYLRDHCGSTNKVND